MRITEDRTPPSGAATPGRRLIASHDGRANADAAGTPVLTRDLLASGRSVALAAGDDPAAQLTSEAERAASLAAFMARRPSGDVWVFAYGSLIWNPAMKTSERRMARIEGWHRAFCLSMTAGRGTTEQPGLALGLNRGGECLGVAYRIDEDQLHCELPLLWCREMLFGGYVPRWVETRDLEGHILGPAITFTIDPHHRHYAGGLPRRAMVQRLTNAAGSWGSAANYLFRTISALRHNGIHDADLENMGARVAAATLSA
ncbi:gamma-glutamylcyclotransferase [bacterium]|nr:gamma-glutamylcyclotransferase [bacterium]